MALADYHKCAVCGGKAFYDADIRDPQYVATWDPEEAEETPPIKIKAICPECAETHDVVVVALRPAPAGEVEGLVSRVIAIVSGRIQPPGPGTIRERVEREIADALTALQERAEAAEKRAEEAEAEAVRLRENAKTLRRARYALDAADDDDWDRLLRFIPTSGYGGFWRYTLLTLRAALGARHD